MVRRGLRIALLALFAAGCASAGGLQTKADAPINLALFGSYQWGEHAPDLNPDLSNRARTAIARRLTERGLASGADGALSIVVAMDTQLGKRLTDFGDAFFIPGYGVHPGIHVPGAYPRADVQEYIEGRLVLSIYDARNGALLWNGVASAPIDPASDEDIDRMACALLARAWS